MIKLEKFSSKYKNFSPIIIFKFFIFVDDEQKGSCCFWFYIKFSKKNSYSWKYKTVIEEKIRIFYNKLFIKWKRYWQIKKI